MTSKVHEKMVLTGFKISMPAYHSRVPVRSALDWHLTSNFLLMQTLSQISELLLPLVNTEFEFLVSSLSLGS